MITSPTEKAGWLLILALLAGCSGAPIMPEKHAFSAWQRIDHVFPSAPAWLQGLTAAHRTAIQYFHRPVGMDARDGLLYVLDADAGLVQIIDPRTLQLRNSLDYARYNGASRPVDVTVSAQHKLYLPVEETGQVLVFDGLSGQPKKALQAAGNMVSPVSVVVTDDEHAYVADSGYDYVVVFDAAGHPVRALSERGTEEGQLLMTTAVAQMNDQRLLVSSRIAGKVQIFDQNGVYQARLGKDVLRYPVAAVEDGFDRVFVADRQDNRIYVFKEGALLGYMGGNGVGLGHFSGLRDLAVDGNTLYVLDELRREVQMIQLTGQLPLHNDR